MELTLPIREVAPATPRTRLLRLDLEGQPFRTRRDRACSSAGRGSPSGVPTPWPRRRTRPTKGAASTCSSASTTPAARARTSGRWHPACRSPRGADGRLRAAPRMSERHALFVAGDRHRAAAGAARRALRREPSVIPDLLYSARGPGRIRLRCRAAGAGGCRAHPAAPDHHARWAGSGLGGHRRPHRPRPPRLRATRRATLCFVCGPHALVQDVPRPSRSSGCSPTASASKSGRRTAPGSPEGRRRSALGFDLQGRLDVGHPRDLPRELHRGLASCCVLTRPESVTTPLKVSTSMRSRPRRVVQQRRLHPRGDRSRRRWSRRRSCRTPHEERQHEHGRPRQGWSVWSNASSVPPTRAAAN
jgi:hypothetical protein